MIELFLVDNEISLLKVMKRFLEKKGFEVIHIAKNGQEAIEKYKKSIKKPDDMIIEYHMPILNGIKTAKQIYSIDKKCKIIIISSNDSINQKNLPENFSGFLKEPFGLNKLISRISSG